MSQGKLTSECGCQCQPQPFKWYMKNFDWPARHAQRTCSTLPDKLPDAHHMAGNFHQNYYFVSFVSYLGEYLEFNFEQSHSARSSYHEMKAQPSLTECSFTMYAHRILLHGEEGENIGNHDKI